jgi:CheY-like chemotaxis protein
VLSVSIQYLELRKQLPSERTTLGRTQEQMTNPQAKPKVLVADDERVIADTLAIILNQSGFDATAVYSGEKAVEAARSLKPDMLISDVIMTDMNGIDAAITIRTLLPDCKILLFSGQAATADLLDRARVQGHEFEILAKPVHPQDLLARLRG